MHKQLKQLQLQLGYIQKSIKQKLSSIRQLDIKCLQLQAEIEELRQVYLAQLRRNHNLINENSRRTQYLKKITSLQIQLKELCHKKVEISNSLSQQLFEASNLVQSQINQKQLQSPKVFKSEIKQSHLLSHGISHSKNIKKHYDQQIQQIIQQYYQLQQVTQSKVNKLDVTQQGRKYCICQDEKELKFPKDMIACDDHKCLVQWFHFQCVNITQLSIPDTWYCKQCASKNHYNLRKVTWNHSFDPYQAIYQENQTRLKNQNKAKQTKSLKAK